MKYANIREEELKIKIAQDYFWLYDCTKIVGNVDFCVCMLQSNRELYEQESLLWAEAKKGASDVYKSLVQLILTIGKARTFDKHLPPAFLGAFDSEKIAFIPYSEIHDIFYLNDFNWNVAPSNYNTKEFKLVLEKVSAIIDHKALLFHYEKDDSELKKFIKSNFIVGNFGTTKIKIDKNNFIAVYNKWLETVKPTIGVDWKTAKKMDIIDGDFYLADLLSVNNTTIKGKLSVLLKNDMYKYNKQTDVLSDLFRDAYFNDKQCAHTQFWNRYERPPKEDYWDYILLRRVLLVPQDVRERKGAFFTPPQWVAKAHEYLTKTFGENWQDEYYVWDNSAGSGNLLVGLVNKDNIWASTLDKQDVDVMHDRIENGANLWKEQVFQFDFLNDDFIPKSKGGKLPDELFEIINNPEKRKKLIFLINPPYGEATTGQGRGHKTGVKESKTKERFNEILGVSLVEKFIQFFARIYTDIPDCKMASFVTPKYICGSNTKKFRKFWKAEYLGGFATPARTHDNCSGKYPICLFIWDLEQKKDFPENVPCDIFNEKEEYKGVKTFYSYEGKKISDWLRNYFDKKNNIGFLRFAGTDFQKSGDVFITSKPTENDVKKHMIQTITQNNLIPFCVYYAVRHCIEYMWLNNTDQFLFPNDGWQNDKEFQNDCLAYTLFHRQNKISIKDVVNHWIPFSEKEINAKYKFESHFMLSFINGKIIRNGYSDLFEQNANDWCEKREFSTEATAVFDAGRELWRYYHSQKNANPNAAFYDIREYFQGRNEKGKMGTKSNNKTYNQLIGNLRDKMKILAKKIEPKVYEYEFLK